MCFDLLVLPAETRYLLLKTRTTRYLRYLGSMYCGEGVRYFAGV